MSLAKTAAKKHRVPKALEHRAQAIMRKGHDEQSAYAIATAASQREGRLKKGTHQLTKKGRGWESKHQKEAQLLNDRPQEIEAASPGASLGLSSRPGSGENIPDHVLAERRKASKGLKKFRRSVGSNAANQETKVIPHSVYDGEIKKKRFSPSEFYSPHSN
jgi:hypothetical protein